MINKQFWQRAGAFISAVVIFVIHSEIKLVTRLYFGIVLVEDFHLIRSVKV